MLLPGTRVCRHYFVFLCAAVLLTSCASRGPANSEANAQPKLVRVKVVSAESRPVSASFEENGSFVAQESSNLAPFAEGRVTATPVDVGTYVKKGQLIVQLDKRDAELKLRQVKAQLDQANASLRQAQSRLGLTSSTFDPDAVPEVAGAKAAYESAMAQAKLAAADSNRYANLVATGDVSQSASERARTQQETAEAQASVAKRQYDASSNGARQSYQIVSSAEASVESTRAQVAQAEKALADTSIRAPFDGYITARPVAVGEHVALATKIATLVQIKTLKLQLQTPEQRAARAKLGMQVFARVAAYPDRQFEGKISAINPSVDPSSRVFILEARFDNKENVLRPGMFATAQVLLEGGEDGVFVPRNAVVRDKTTDSNQVYVVEGGKSRLRVVLTGESDGDRVRIISGLSGKERVVLNNQTQLYDGAPVEAVS